MDPLPDNVIIRIINKQKNYAVQIKKQDNGKLHVQELIRVRGQLVVSGGAPNLENVDKALAILNWLLEPMDSFEVVSNKSYGFNGKVLYLDKTVSTAVSN